MYPFKVLTNKIDSFLDHFFCSNPVSNIIYYLEKKSETLETCQLSGFFFTTGEIFEKCDWVLFSQGGGVSLETPKKWKPFRSNFPPTFQ